MRLLYVILAGVAFLFGQQDEAYLAPIKLSAGFSKSLPVPSFSYSGQVQCDPDGSLFFQSGLSVKGKAILKVPMDGHPVIYRPTGEQADGVYFVGFHVAANGKIWMLESGNKQDEPYVFRIDPADPGESERIKLAAPAGIVGLSIKNFVVLASEHPVLQGYFTDKAPKENQGHSYLAEFDRSGKLVRLKTETASSEALAYAAKWAPETVVAQTADGTTYMLRQDRILVLSPSGDVTRTIHLTPSQEGYSATNFYMNRGRLVVVFFGPNPEAGKPAIMRYALVDPSNGDIIRWYQPDKDLGNNLVCFSDDGLVFLRFEKGHLKVVTAPIK